MSSCQRLVEGAEESLPSLSVIDKVPGCPHSILSPPKGGFRLSGLTHLPVQPTCSLGDLSRTGWCLSL